MDRVLSLSSDGHFSVSSVLMKFGLMSWGNKSSNCLDNCSGHGECHNGTCVCEIQYEGEVCRTPNFSYHAAFASIFFFLALVCLIQLVMCIAAEFQKMKTPSLWRACRITTQKLLYIVVFLATIIRGAYFTSPNTEDGWPRTMMSAFYPLLLSGSSLIVCFWAELFHLQDVRCERPQFLSKSFLGFVIFNIISYFFLIIELVTTTKIAPTAEERNFYVHVFNGCYAVLLFIVVVFFLIYGVEVYFKVRGGFICEHEASVMAMTLANRWTNRENGKGKKQKAKASTSKEEDGASSSRLLDKNFEPQISRKIDTSQLHQSRLGLVSQAIMLFIVVGFLFSETLSEFWKSKVPIVSRNWHDILFHIVEIGVVLWFPCVLWNCISPEQLWILNPKKLIKIEADFSSTAEAKEKSTDSDSEESDCEDGLDCWICYDPERKDAGPLIKPCQCRGDVSNVHHNCLRRWLVESALDDPKSPASDKLRCKVCGAAYQVEQSSHLDWQQGFTLHHWLQTSAIVTAMCISAAVAWVLVQFFTEPFIRLLAIGGSLLVFYIGMRFLGLNTATAYERAKVSALNIVGQTPTQSPTPSECSNLAVNTISETIAVNLQSSNSGLLSSKK